MIKTARQRRTWVLPAPTGGLDRSDRYAIGLFYAIAFAVVEIILPLRVMFTSKSKLQFFKSLWEKNIFVSARKHKRNN
jgi:hypothetical protein